MKKDILIIVSAFILFGFSFALSSCKKCSKNEPGDGNTNNTPSDTKTSNATTDDPTSLSDDADGDCGGGDSADHGRGGDILTKEKERVLSELAKVASATVVVRGVKLNIPNVRRDKKQLSAAKATLKEEMLKIEEAVKATKSARNPANTEITTIAKAIELLEKLARWQVFVAEVYSTPDGRRALALIDKEANPAKKAYDEMGNENPKALDMAKEAYAKACVKTGGDLKDMDLLFGDHKDKKG